MQVSIKLIKAYLKEILGKKSRKIFDLVFPHYIHNQATRQRLCSATNFKACFHCNNKIKKLNVWKNAVKKNFEGWWSIKAHIKETYSCDY